MHCVASASAAVYCVPRSVYNRSAESRSYAIPCNSGLTLYRLRRRTLRKTAPRLAPGRGARPACTRRRQSPPAPEPRTYGTATRRAEWRALAGSTQRCLLLPLLLLLVLQVLLLDRVISLIVSGIYRDGLKRSQYHRGRESKTGAPVSFHRHGNGRRGAVRMRPNALLPA